MRLGEAVRVVHRLRHLGLGLEIRRRAAPKPLVGCRRADLALLLIPALEQLFEVIGQYAHPLPPNPDLHLAEIQLQLLARRRLEAHRRHRLPPQFFSKRLDRPLYCANIQFDFVLDLEFLMHHHRIPAVF